MLKIHQDKGAPYAASFGCRTVETLRTLLNRVRDFHTMPTLFANTDVVLECQ